MDQILIVFRKALDEALIGSTETISINGAPIRAADPEVVSDRVLRHLRRQG